MSQSNFFTFVYPSNGSPFGGALVAGSWCVGSRWAPHALLIDVAVGAWRWQTAWFEASEVSKECVG
jgi:hypothetical protein